MTDRRTTDQSRVGVSDDLDHAHAVAWLEALPIAAALFRRSGMLYAVNTLGRHVYAVDARASLTVQSSAEVLLPFGPAGPALLDRALATDALATCLLPHARDGRLLDVRAVPFDRAWLLLTATAMTNEQHDITDRDSHLSAMARFAAGVMHDVNNTLNPIMAAAYLLRHHAESPDAVRDYADRIRQAVETSASSAARVWRFVRQEPVHAGGDEALDLSVLAAGVVDDTAILRAHREPGRDAIELVCQFAREVRTRGLPDEIRVALVNLVHNAVEAMSHGGTLTVRTYEEGSAACVSVRDTGRGMPAEVRERAFEPFFTTKESKASGLGLAEVYGVVRRHRGTASITSLADGGTEVTLRFPRLVMDAPVETPVETVAASTVASHEVAPLTILVVEDHVDGRELLRRLLQADGHRVDAVGTCVDAHERLAFGAGSAYDLLITDVGLPDGSGWDLVRYARRQSPEIRIGVITGWEPTAHPDASHGADFILGKPLRSVELLAHISGRAAPASPIG